MIPQLIAASAKLNIGLKKMKCSPPTNGNSIRFKDFSLTNHNLQFRIESRKKTCHHILKTIEHGECTDQRQRSKCHSTHRNAGNDIDSVVFLLREEIAPGYVEGKVHFNNSSIFSR